MATTIKLKNGSGAPLAGDLVQGEPALDLTNKRLYTEDSGGTVIEVGTNPSTLTVDTDTLVVDAANNRVGIGTASPAELLHLKTEGTQLLVEDTSSGNKGSFFAANTATVISSDPDNAVASSILQFQIDGSEHMRIDSSGNVGIGVTPSSWNSNNTALQVGAAGCIFGSTNTSLSAVSANAYFDSTDTRYEYISTDFATLYQQLDGVHSWSTAASGTAGNAISFSESMRIDSSGNVGIGTSSPEVLTHLKSSDNTIFEIESTTATAYMKMIDSNTTGAGYIGYITNDMTFWANNAERMRINSNGDLLVRNTSGGDFQTSGRGLVVIDGTSDCAVEMKAGGTTYGYMYTSAAEFRAGNYTANPFTFYTNNTERMRIDSSGNVGIGTDSPNISSGASGSSALTISASTADNSNRNGLLELRGTRSGTGLVVSYMRTFNNSATTPITDIQSIRGSTDTLGEMAFLTSNTEAMRIDSSGNVGYTGKLYSSNSLGTAQGLQLYRDHATGSCYLFDSTTAPFSGPLIFGTNNTERMRIDNSGVLMLGRTSTTVNQSNFGFVVFPSGLLNTSRNVTGTSGVVQFYGNAGQFRTMGDGDAQNTNNSYGAISDARLKSNIVDASSQIDDIMAVQVRSYTLNETGDTHIGVVAQELEASGMSGLVKTDDEGMKSVKYSILYMKAIKALQEAITRIETLEAEVAALKGA